MPDPDEAGAGHPWPEPTNTPLPLSYDDLPPGSDLRRIMGAGEERTLTIIAPGGPPAAASPPLFIGAARRTFIIFVLWLVIPSLGAFLLFGANLPRLDPVLRGIAAAAYAILGAAVFMLIWWIERAAYRDCLARGRTQVTILHATPDSLTLETAGPFGAANHRLDAADVCGIAIQTLPSFDHWARSSLALFIRTRDRDPIIAFPARSQAELLWIATVVRRILSIEAPILATDPAKPAASPPSKHDRRRPTG